MLRKSFDAQRGIKIKLVITSHTPFAKGTKGRKEISRKAKEAVEKYGYSQKEVADYLGIHYSTVSRMGIREY